MIADGSWADRVDLSTNGGGTGISCERGAGEEAIVAGGQDDLRGPCRSS